MSVDTIRFYQKRRLLPPPDREGRVAWYGPEHVERLARIRELQRRRAHARADRARSSAATSTRPTRRSRPRSPAPTPRPRGVPLARPSWPSAAESRARCSKRSRAKGCSSRASTTAASATRPPTSRSCAPGLRLARSTASRCRSCSRWRASTTTATREIAEQAVALFDEHVRHRCARPTCPTTRRPSGSSTRSARCCPRSPRSSRTTSGACCSRSRRSTSSRSAKTTSSPRPATKPARPLEQRWPIVIRRATSTALPADDEKARVVEDDVRPHRAALRPAQPAADVPHGRRLAAGRRALAAACARRARARPRVRHRRPLPRRSPTPATRRSASTSRPACWRPRAPTRRSCAATRCAAVPGRRRSTALTCGFALRNFVDLEPCPRRVRARRCGPAGASRSLDVARADERGRARRARPLVPAGRAVRRRAALRPARVRVPPRVHRVPPAAGRARSTIVGAAGFVDVEHRTLGCGRRAADHRDRAHDRDSDARSRGPHPPRRAHRAAAPTPSDLLDHLGAERLRVARRRARLRDGRRRRRSSTPADAVARAAGDRARARATARRPAVGPRAVGALPFDGGGRMVVPARDRRARRRRPGCGAPTIEPPTRGPRRTSRRARTAARSTRSRSSPTPTAGTRTSPRSSRSSTAGAVEKVVLAREVRRRGRRAVRLARDRSPSLRATQPGCIVYADDGFVGASPELLVRRRGPDVTARPMAGTGAARRRRSPAPSKDAREHRLVVDAVVDALARDVRRRRVARHRAGRARRPRPPRDDDHGARARRRHVGRRPRARAAPDAGGRGHAARRPRSRRSRRLEADAARPLRGPVRMGRRARRRRVRRRAARRARSTATGRALHAGAGIVAGSRARRGVGRDPGRSSSRCSRALVRP